MSLVEIFEAISGFNELESERNENYLEGVRVIGYWAAIGSHLDMKKCKIKNPSSILKLKRDKNRKKSELKDWEPVVIEVIYKDNDEQVNG